MVNIISGITLFLSPQTTQIILKTVPNIILYVLTQFNKFNTNTKSIYHNFF